MKHEKTLKREDKSQVMIRIDFSSDSWRMGFAYGVTVMTKQPRKQKWKSVYNSEDYVFRGMKAEQKVNHIEEKQLKHVTPDEILTAKMECWEKMKPTID